MEPPKTNLLDFIHERMFAALAENGKSLRAMSLELGENDRYLANLKARKGDVPITTFAKICATFKLDPSTIMGMGQQMRFKYAASGETAEDLDGSFRQTLGFDQLLEAWHAGDGRLSSMNKEIYDAVDLFEEPKDGMIQPVSMGSQSLAGQIIGSNDVGEFREALQQTTPQIIERIASHHFSVVQGKPMLTTESIDVVWPNNTIVAYEYDRLLLPVRDDDGRVLILSFSKYIRTLQHAPS
ncbi:MAG: hypothetical protein ACPGGK_08710 [Pikeienuella sp.]